MERVTEAAGLHPEAAADVLAGVVLPQIDRARSLVDLDPLSATYGCADRAYWYYRTLTNFPGATWQQLMLAFACIYRSAHAANPHHLDPQIAALTSGMLCFWANAQHKDGAFDEWYLNEHSYCPTAITGAGAALTLHVMGDALSAAARDAGIAALERAGRWLETRYNAEVMNQNLAAAVALQGLARLRPGSRWDSVARAKLDRIGNDQTREGWFPEYGGMDFGYSTLALDLLAACRMLGAPSVVDDMAARLCGFLLESAGVGLAPPGRLGSRGTSHAFPFGAMLFAANDANASFLAERQLRGLALRLVPRPESVDDRYFAYFHLPQFALALHCAGNGAAAVEPARARDGASNLAGSGLAITRRAGWSVSISRRLGGALALETPDGPPLYHLGYEVSTTDGKRFSSAAWSSQDGPARATEGELPAIDVRFRAVSSGLPLRWLMVPFQAVVYLLRSSAAATAFQALVKRKMIAPRSALPLRLVRRIEVGPDAVHVRDTLSPESALPRLSRLEIAAAISMHSPSARQDAARVASASEEVLARACALLNAGRSAVLCWTCSTGSPAGPLVLDEGKRP